MPQGDTLTPFSPWQPRHGNLIAWVVFIAAALTICWPMLTGQFLIGDDQFIAGYGFRLFGAEEFKRTGAVPQWNPFLFGGLPFVAAGHGEIFYPTAMLRWIMPVQAAMNFQIFIHLVLAGWFMHRFMLALGAAWGAALGAGVAYELTGIMASMVSPGHDGKMMVTAFAPLIFLGLLRAIRDNRTSGYGVVAVVSGLGLISPHFQMMYYLFVAAGLWTLYLLFLHPERNPAVRWPVALAAASGAVLLGLVISAVQVFPFYEYIPWSPRSLEGPSRGWEYATAWSMPPLELFTTVLPEFNGVLQSYWGQNSFKMHTEYLGATVVILAILAWGPAERRRVLGALAGIGVLFLLVAFAAYTPFYRVWYEVMPFMKSVRAAGMAFFLPAFVACVMAGLGLDRLLRGTVTSRRVLTAAGSLAILGVLGVTGVLQAVAEAVASPERLPAAMANADALRLGALRLLAVSLAAGGLFWAIQSRRVAGALAAGCAALLLTVDAWSIDRHFASYKPPAAISFGGDALTRRMQETPLPFRVWQPAGVYSGLGVYPPSWLMAYRIPTLLGYHGNELRTFDDLLGGKNEWRNQVHPGLWNLFGVRYLLLNQPQEIPGFTKVLGPEPTVLGGEGYLYEADAPPPYVRVMAGAIKIPEAELATTAADPRFPVTEVVLLSDTSSAVVEPIGDSIPAAASVVPQVAHWEPGLIRVTLEGSDPRQTYLTVAENWYPDWTATVDGNPVPTLRAQNSVLGIQLPSGAREVEFRYVSRHHGRFKGVSLAASLAACLLLVVPGLRERRKESAGG